MPENDLPDMIFRRDGKEYKPIKVFRPEENIIVGVYQGNLSEFDILIKYRQVLEDGRWSRIRTPKHVHWTVDVLMKMSNERQKVKDFLDFLIDLWEKTEPIKNESERKKALDVKNLIKSDQDKIEKYRSLSKKGEYKVEFLIFLAKLLMIQEKTNMEDAHMFKKLLEKLKEGEDLFSILSTATYS